MAKTCSNCKKEQNNSQFIGTKSFLHTGFSPICRKCLNNFIENAEPDKKWATINKILQWLDIPFLPTQWEKFAAANGSNALGAYCAVFRSKEHETVDWTDYNMEYLIMNDEQRLADALPELKEQAILSLKKKWGYQYDDFQLEYLEQLHEGILRTQNINGNLQEDQLLKLCRVSLQIEEKIRGDCEIDKDLKNYDSLVKLLGLTPKESKNGNDFDSTGELFAYLEKSDWINKYDYSAPRDQVDTTIKNIQEWNRRLYVNESGISEEIEQRIKNLKEAAELDKQIGFDVNYEDMDDADIYAEEDDDEAFEVIL